MLMNYPVVTANRWTLIYLSRLFVRLYWFRPSFDSRNPFQIRRRKPSMSLLRSPLNSLLRPYPVSVETCLKMCGLESHAEAIVGSLGVEHKKRTTIAVELAAKPKLLLFLDEPTSGLDSQSAWAITAFLRTLADNGQAILCTYVIHQRIIFAFSHLIPVFTSRRANCSKFSIGYFSSARADKLFTSVTLELMLRHLSNISRARADVPANRKRTR